MATATTDPVRLPPALPLPKLVQSVLFLTSLQYSVVPRLSRHYGGPFTINLPVFGKTVVIHDRDIVKDVYSTSFDLIERPTKVLGQAFGPGSTFSLLGKEHSERRKLVLPNFSGKRVKNYESIVEDEVLRETANWPEGQEFETLETMTRLTLNAIMRATFGERADALDELRDRDTAVDHPGLADAADAAGRATRIRSLESGQQAGGLSATFRRGDRRTHRRGARRVVTGRSHRHARTAVAGPLRRRPADLGSPHRRRAADIGGRRP